MASYHLSVKTGKKGQAATHAAYIRRSGKHQSRGDLILTEWGNLPDWAHNDPKKFWPQADRHERANGSTYLEFVVALPNELTSDQNSELLREFVAAEALGKPYEFAIHCPQASIGNVDQPHAHVMINNRIPDGINRTPEQHFRRANPVHPELGGCRKSSGGKHRGQMGQQLETTRENWANLQNAALERHGHEARVDHRSLKAQGKVHEPERHLGALRIHKLTEEQRLEVMTRRTA